MRTPWSGCGNGTPTKWTGESKSRREGFGMRRVHYTNGKKNAMFVLVESKGCTVQKFLFRNQVPFHEKLSYRELGTCC